jgi:transcriptional regulator GlxA family with amidase domain
VLGYYREYYSEQIVKEKHQILPAQLRRCVQFIQQNLGTDLTISVLLQQAEISERSLFVIFHNFLGVTPKEYVRHERLRRARVLLLSGRYSVTDAARMAGFKHMGRFSHQYRKHYGEKPSHTPLMSETIQ